MAVPIRMPQPGQMTEECTVLQWFKAEGDSVAKGDPLFEIETDKSNMDIEAFDTGTLLRIVAGVGVTVPVDSVVAWIGQPGEEIPEAGDATVGAVGAVPIAQDRSALEAVEQIAKGGAPAPAPGGENAPTSAPGGGDPPTTGIPTGESAPTGIGDVGQVEIGQVQVWQTLDEAEPPSPAATSTTARGRIAISPRASRAAAELGVDVATIAGSGPGGRIVERDVRAARAPAPSGALVVSAAAEDAGAQGTAGMGAPTPTPASTPTREQDTDAGEPMSRMRQVIARRLTESVATIPHFTVTVAVDMSGLVALRAEIRESSPISLTDLIHAATVASLREFPLVNARTDGVTMWRRDAVHLGIAVSVPGGLLVPVIRDADSMSLERLQERTREVITAARAGKLGPDELSGSTFTVSNMGMYGVEEFSAIINPGESGILAVSSIVPQVVPVGDGIAVRQMMRLTLSADHRLVDGELAARFLDGLRSRLQDAAAWRAQVVLTTKET